MLERLKEALEEGRGLTGADYEWYRHELWEDALRNQGLDQETAHEQTFKDLKQDPYSVYPLEVIKKYSERFDSSSWLRYWREYHGLQ